MLMNKIRVLVVDDSYFMRKFLNDALAKDPALEVVGTAQDAFEAKKKVLELSPDVMTLDVEMPKINGIEFLKQLMPQSPLPVVMVSSVNGIVFDALQAGAVDFVSKSSLRESEKNKNSFLAELIVKIKIASIAQVGQYKRTFSSDKISNLSQNKNLGKSLIAIGASTGGTEAIADILKELNRDVPGIVIVQHMPPVFTKLYADRLNNTCPLEVKEARDGDEALPGRALIAPGDFQMQIVAERNKYIAKVYKGEKVNGHSPSVDVLFNSVAVAAGKNALGIILTGMGGDGANGLLNMRKNGANTIGQNEKSCIVYGMPMVAMKVGAVESELPLQSISKKIYEWNDQRHK